MADVQVRTVRTVTVQQGPGRPAIEIEADDGLVSVSLRWPDGQTLGAVVFDAAVADRVSDAIAGVVVP